MASAQRRVWVVAVFVLPAFAVLVGLGVWQLERLSWKEALIARIDSRIHAPPSPLPPESAWGQLVPEDYDYTHVTVTGTFDHAHEVMLFRAAGGTGAAGAVPGYQVLTPLVLADGAEVIVNRGFVPLANKDPATRASGQVAGTVTLTGLMRAPEGRNPFTPPDDPVQNVWFTRDPAAVARASHLARVAPFAVDADAVPGATGLPMAGATVLNVPNNHLSYALTWFALALTLLGVSVAFVVKRG